MRIAIVASARSSISPPFAGGLEMHTHVLAEGLTARGHDVTVLAAAGAGDFRLDPMRPLVRVRIGGGRHDLCADPASALSESDSYLDAMLRLGGSTYDLVHLNTVHYLPFGCAAMVPMPVTGTLHTPPYPWLRAALQGSASSVDPISIANVSATNAARWHLAGLDQRVILNGVDLDTWLPGAGGHGAVWTGRIVPEKAPHLAIDAARRAGMAMRLVGPVHDETYFATEIEPRLGRGVDYVGHWSATDLAEVVGAASVAVVTPSWDEPFGLIVAEALACGTPVAAFDRGAMAELISPSVGRLAPPGDVAGLAHAMRAAVLLDRSACRHTAERRFDSARMIDEYETWFEDEISHHRSRRVLRLVPRFTTDATDAIDASGAAGS